MSPSSYSPGPVVAQENARRLRERFRPMRNFLKRHIERSDGSYDIHRIREVLRIGGLAPDEHGVVERADAVQAEHLVDPGQTIERAYGDPRDHYIFREREGRSAACRAFVIDDALLSFDVRNAALPEFYVFDGGKRLVNGLFFGAAPFLEPPSVHIDRPAVFAEDVFTAYNICHLLFDKVPRYAFGRGLHDDAIGLLYHANEYTTEVASLMGGTFVGLAREHRRGTISARRLTVFENAITGLSHPLQNGAPFHVQTLLELRASAAKRDRGRPEPPGKVMIDRNARPTRLLLNQDEVAPLANERGFELLDPAALAPADQMRHFVRTETLIGVHGAGLANLAFMPEGSEVLELLPQLCATPAYAIAAQHLGLRYRYLVLPDPELGWVDPATTRHDTQHNRRDVYAPPDRFASFLDR